MSTGESDFKVKPLAERLKPIQRRLTAAPHSWSIASSALYTIAIGRREGPTYTSGELEAAGGEIALSVDG